MARFQYWGLEWGWVFKGVEFGVWESLTLVCFFSYFSICALITCAIFIMPFSHVPILPKIFFECIGIENYLNILVS